MGYVGKAFRLARNAVLASIIVAVVAYFAMPAGTHYPASSPDDFSYDFNVTHRFFNTNGIRLHALDTVASDGQKPTILFLHGFPEFSNMWRKQMKHFSSLGYRCVALDQRGYYVSEKPAEVSAYTVDELVKDAKGVIDQIADGRKIVLVGHDWGAMVTWATSLAHPSLVEKMVALNVPHPIAFETVIKSSWTQVKKSWYMLFFQLPYIPEWFLAADSRKTYGSIFSETIPGSVTDEDIDRLVIACSKPGGVTSPMNWYRAMFRSSIYDAITGAPPPSYIAKPMVEVPALLLWGENDMALETQMAYESEQFITKGRVVIVPNTTHWIVEERPEIINKEIEHFLNE